MGLFYRKGRSFVILIAGLLAIALNHTMDGFSVVFGISLVVASAFTLIFVFFHFDEDINQKIVVEMIMDGFAGIVLFTYPNSNQDFLLVDFSFWILVMGALTLTSGLMEKSTQNYMWFYTLVSIMIMALGFVVMHYRSELIDSVLYVIGFSLLIYSSMNIYLLYKRKKDVYD